MIIGRLLYLSGWNHHKDQEIHQIRYTMHVRYLKEKIYCFQKLKDYLSPFVKSPKKQIEVHHIFPKNYLQTVKNLKQRDYNQIANMIYIDYHKNIKISDKPPHEYWSEILEECSDNTREFVEKNYVEVYDLPYEFWNMDYFDFLEERRKLMAESIRKYFEKL